MTDKVSVVRDLTQLVPMSRSIWNGPYAPIFYVQGLDCMAQIGKDAGAPMSRDWTVCAIRDKNEWQKPIN